MVKMMSSLILLVLLALLIIADMTDMAVLAATVEINIVVLRIVVSRYFEGVGVGRS